MFEVTLEMRRLGAACGSAYDVIEADAAEVEELAIAACRPPGRTSPLRRCSRRRRGDSVVGTLAQADVLTREPRSRRPPTAPTTSPREGRPPPG